MKSFVRDPPETICTLLPDLKDVKPIVKSVSFHRYGKEFAITVTGENLWFCNKVKVGPLKQSINAGDSSQKLLQFYRNVKDITSISSTSDHINVKAWSHFSGPVSNDKAVVKRKVSCSQLQDCAYTCVYSQRQQKLVTQELAFHISY